MASKKFLIYAAATLCVAAVKSIVADARCGDFVTSCRAPYEHSNGFLRGTCRTDDGRWVVTSINLDPHISNVNGNMVGGSGYEKSCESLGFFRSSKDFIITGSCKKFDGFFRDTGFEVNRRISNDNGKLVFNNCRRRRSLLEISSDESSVQGAQNQTEVTVSSVAHSTNRRLLAR